MVRKEIYFIDDKEVTKDEWELKLKDENNLSTLTVKYEEIKDIAYLMKLIEDLKQEIRELKKSNQTEENWWDKYKILPFYPNIPNITYPTYPTCTADWTYGPEQRPVYITTYKA